MAASRFASFSLTAPRCFCISKIVREDQDSLRCLLRCCIPSSDLLNTGELRKEIRQGFDQERGVKDVYAMKYSLSNGRVQLKQLRDMLGMRH